ncbi:MAG: cell division protein ZapB [Acidobacteriota bacterium]|nr:cell division protein ZapB [Acidobacteriota bacterium]
MAVVNQENEVDTLTHLEERIQRAVTLVHTLRQEKEDALKELGETQAAWEESQTANQKLTEELDSLRTERKQVRNRLEKLLGHIDQLDPA